MCTSVGTFSRSWALTDHTSKEKWEFLLQWSATPAAPQVGVGPVSPPPSPFTILTDLSFVSVVQVVISACMHMRTHTHTHTHTHAPILLCFVLCFWDRFFCSSCCSQTCYVTDTDFNFYLSWLLCAGITGVEHLAHFSVLYFHSSVPLCPMKMVSCHFVLFLCDLSLKHNLLLRQDLIASLISLGRGKILLGMNLTFGM